MGYGDEIMATGMARGLRARGKRAAFGDGHMIFWSEQAREVFYGNPNVAPPGSERCSDLVWFRHYRGHRLYAVKALGHWRWRDEFRVQPGELYLTDEEREWAERAGSGFVLVEPSVKFTALNKQWPVERYQEVVRELRRTHRVVQVGTGDLLSGAERVETPTFRRAAAVLQRAALYIGPEGGLHHAAAALGTRAVVIFGGFIHPRTTGYDGHVNLFSGGRACGTIGRRCNHCREAMLQITVKTVLQRARGELV